MAYRLKAGEPFTGAVKRIAIEQVERAIVAIDDRDVGPDETVHRVRKRCKKIRGLLRLARPAFEETYEEENRTFRDAARRLSPLRDATSMLECFDALMQRNVDDTESRAFDGLRERLESHHARLNEDLDAEDRLSEFRGDMKAAKQRVQGWSFDDDGFEDVTAGVRKTYKRGRRAMTIAGEDPTDMAFHQWRKRVKYHWYHMRLLRSLWDPVIDARARVLDRLSKRLGDDHDLAVLRRWLQDSSGHFGEAERLFGLIDERRAELQARTRPLGMRLYAERPSKLARRFERYWHAWLVEQQVEGALPDASDELTSWGPGGT